VSLYRQAGASRTRLAVVAVLAAVAGVAGGFAIGRASAPEPTLEELVSDARDDARPALSSLELVGIEYGQAVKPSGGVNSATEYQAAVDHVAAAVSAIDDATALETVDPQAVEAARERLAELEAAVEEEAPPGEIADLVTAARAAVEEITRP
jgi:hypothetical protein